ncbi:MAG: hypothetical protein A4E42_00812 [Methanoregulaceae archaeon PtaU1.Bin222]|nr:MAG: hypothetical protein A4E42_00812 [Methanoregulaceae archaeon PtaU1.Bin222]
MKIIKNDEAVSPVIGVILMVAITVILAAVIAAFVFGMAGTTQTTKNVGITATANATAFTITTQGGTDFNTLTKLEWVPPNGTGYNLTDFKKQVGQTIILQGANEPVGIGNKLTVRGTFQDGSQQVLFDRQY